MSRRAIALALAVAAAATAFVLPGVPVEAAASPTPVPTWVTNGEVHAVVEAGGRTYVGGVFDQVGPGTGFGVHLDRTTGTLSNSVKVDGHVYVAVPDGKGGWYIGGDFLHVTQADGDVKSRHNGAQITADGRVGSWNPNTDRAIRAIVHDPIRDRIYAGGEFTTAKNDSVAVNGLVVTTDSGSGTPIPFAATGLGHRVDSLALSPDGSRLYVGGTFTTIGGLGRSGLAAIDTGSGAVDATWNPAPDTVAATELPPTPGRTVAALATDSSGRVFVGGTFTQIAGATVGGLAVLDPTGLGSLDGTWAVTADGPVESFALTSDRSRLYVGGGFTTLGGQPRARLAALATAGAGSVDGAFDAGADGDVLALRLSADGGRLYAGGAFRSIGGTARRFLAALDAGSGAVDTAFDARVGATVRAVGTSTGTNPIFAGGDFTHVNGTAVGNLAALDSNGVLDGNFVANTDGEVAALLYSAGKLYIGGTFTHVTNTGNVMRSQVRLARLDAVSGLVDTGFRASPSAAVNALALSGSRLFVGGAFTAMSGTPRNSLASVNAVTGDVDGWDPDVNSNVADLALSPDQGTVYIGGDFTRVGSATRSMAAAVDAASGLATAWKPTPAALVVKLAVSGDGSRVFLAQRGSFKDGNRLQAYTTAGAGSLSWEHRADGDFQAVAVTSSVLYAGGHFTAIQGQDRVHLAAFDPITGALHPWSPFVSGGTGHGVFDIEISPTTLTVGGDFDVAGDETTRLVAQGITRFANNDDPPPTTTTLPPGATTTTTTTAPPGGGGGGGGSDPGAGPAATRAGYWMVGADGTVYNFGESGHFGNARPTAGASAVDLEPTPSGRGYWIVNNAGVVTTHGDAAPFGSTPAGILTKGEVVTSLSATPTGRGYWIFTSRGRVLNLGDAAFYGDMSKATLNGPVLDSIPTTSGRGYYMVASDGGIFAFGDAVFRGSMGGQKLNAPVQSLVPDGDGVGYWLVAADGGIFAFQAGFKGSMGGTKLNKPVTGMVRFADGYLMVGEDGGIFNFSTKPFLGSLGGNPPARPIVSVAALG